MSTSGFALYCSRSSTIAKTSKWISKNYWWTNAKSNSSQCLIRRGKTGRCGVARTAMSMQAPSRTGRRGLMWQTTRRKMNSPSLWCTSMISRSSISAERNKCTATCTWSRSCILPSSWMATSSRLASKICRSRSITKMWKFFATWSLS